MVLLQDKEFKETKSIKLRLRDINPDFKELADWLNINYNHKILNITYDTISNLRPRLNIIFEFTSDKNKYYSNRGYDTGMQKTIANQFYEIVNSRNLYERYNTKNIFVTFQDFESIAKIESNDKIDKSLIKYLKDLYVNIIWEISPGFSAPTIFFYTNSDLHNVSFAGLKEEIRKRYFDLLKVNDEFGYINNDNFIVYFDSKENFDTNYSSNWFYYYK